MYPHKFGHEFINMNIKLIECIMFLGDIDAAENELKRLEHIDFSRKVDLKEDCIKLRDLDNTVTEFYNAMNFENGR